MLGLGELMDRKPAALSGGQRQRVAMGRALVREPRAFLMDEPLSNLDAKLRTSMRGELARLHERLPTTTVYVTHDQVEAMTLGDRVAVLRDGVIQQCDVPQRALRRAREPLRRRLHRLAGDEPASRRTSTARDRQLRYDASSAAGRDGHRRARRRPRAAADELRWSPTATAIRPGRAMRGRRRRGRAARLGVQPALHASTPRRSRPRTVEGGDRRRERAPTRAGCSPTTAAPASPPGYPGRPPSAPVAASSSPSTPPSSTSSTRPLAPPSRSIAPRSAPSCTTGHFVAGSSPARPIPIASVACCGTLSSRLRSRFRSGQKRSGCANGSQSSPRLSTSSV